MGLADVYGVRQLWPRTAVGFQFIFVVWPARGAVSGWLNGTDAAERLVSHLGSSRIPPDFP